MLITADQILAHAIGDYVLQSHWMATNKTKRLTVAALHAVTYTATFLLFSPSWLALGVIFGTHVLIDRFRLARYVCWFKNWIWGGRLNAPGWWRVTATGYPDDVPPWLSVWLLIIADNVCHILVNGIALRYL